MNSFIYRSLSQQLAILALVVFGVACNRPSPSEIYAPDKKAINGYDPVAFFTEQKPVMGSAAFAYQWKDATWQFASQQHLDSFKAAPDKYSPQYGGWCAYGTAEGHKAPTQADTWTVQDGKLYFNYNTDVKNTWDKDRPGLIKKADAAWPEVKSQE